MQKERNEGGVVFVVFYVDLEESFVSDQTVNFINHDVAHTEVCVCLCVCVCVRSTGGTMSHHTEHTVRSIGYSWFLVQLHEVSHFKKA